MSTIVTTSIASVAPHHGSPHTIKLCLGKRYGKPHIFIVDAKQMAADGFVFYQSENNVWLTEKVPAEYLADYS